MKVHVAVISHSAGIDVLYAGASKDKAVATVANWCRDYWQAEDVDMDTGVNDPKTLTDAEVIKAYFLSESVISVGEQCDITEVEFSE
jgi:hypothetical protein